MRKLALDDDILLNIEKPARYIGHEVNSVMKDKNAVDIRFAMCFPEVYEVGMSHLGIQILYDSPPAPAASRPASASPTWCCRSSFCPHGTRNTPSTPAR